MNLKVKQTGNTTKLVRPLHILVLSISLITSSKDTPAAFKDGPIAVQIVGRSLEEEAVIAMSEIVDSALKASAALS
jgi:amidase